MREDTEDYGLVTSPCLVGLLYLHKNIVLQYCFYSSPQGLVYLNTYSSLALFIYHSLYHPHLFLLLPYVFHTILSGITTSDLFETICNSKFLLAILFKLIWPNFNFYSSCESLSHFNIAQPAYYQQFLSIPCISPHSQGVILLSSHYLHPHIFISASPHLLMTLPCTAYFSLFTYWVMELSVSVGGGGVLPLSLIA